MLLGNAADNGFHVAPKGQCIHFQALAEIQAHHRRTVQSSPEVQIETNHLERAFRAIPIGRKAWLFGWSEVTRKTSVYCKV